ncbi:hypothetical protein DB29_01847 [Shouchella clausii]|nr:hypothetical protein DB29_01847 [Shouchella clausii]
MERLIFLLKKRFAICLQTFYCSVPDSMPAATRSSGAFKNGQI